jgi:uncharacterized surface protein with fasciclin (FAS1) repeats
MRNPLRKLPLVLFGLVALSACDQASMPLSPDQAEIAEARAWDPSIVDIAVGGGFDILAAAVGATGLVEVLNGRQHYTVFAPTDAAFYAVCGSWDPATCVGNLVTALDGEANVRNVLLYHVTRGDRNATSVIASGQLQMLYGGTAHISVSGGYAYIDQAKIISPNIRARNGMVHVIDQVILP